MEFKLISIINLYENLKKRNQLKKFLEIEKKKFKNKSEGVKYDYDLILSKLQKKKYQNKIISVLKKNSSKCNRRMERRIFFIEK